jgi:phosphopantetheine adenylyltransferase
VQSNQLRGGRHAFVIMVQDPLTSGHIGISTEATEHAIIIGAVVNALKNFKMMERLKIRVDYNNRVYKGSERMLDCRNSSIASGLLPSNR